MHEDAFGQAEVRQDIIGPVHWQDPNHVTFPPPLPALAAPVAPAAVAPLVRDRPAKRKRAEQTPKQAQGVIAGFGDEEAEEANERRELLGSEDFPSVNDCVALVRTVIAVVSNII